LVLTLRKVAGVIAVTATLGWAAPASAYVYWVSGNHSIGRANLDGTAPDPSFITGISLPWELAVNSNHIFWSEGSGAIGRANIDGTGIDNDLLGGALVAPFGIAVGGGQLYWSSQMGGIGRSALNGSHQDRNLFNPGDYPANEIALDSTHIYWIDGPTNGIGRANLDGSGAKAYFISTPTYLFGLAIGPADNYIYWSNGNDAIGRATVAGGDVDPTFITGAHEAEGVAIFGGHIYCANSGSGAIGRANVDGTDVDQNFITGLTGLTGIAVDGGPAGTASASQGGLWFASRAVGTASPAKVLTVTNTGAGVLKVATAAVTSADFEISGDGCSGAKLLPGASCRLHVRFSPTASGPRRATLTVTSNDTAGPLRVALAGATGWALKLEVSGTGGLIGTQGTIAAATDNFVGETPYGINLYANHVLLATCTTGDQCSVPFTPAPPYPAKVVIAADVARAHSRPFGKRALVSKRRTVTFTRTRPPVCKPLTCM
jgi:hypothetical protein